MELNYMRAVELKKSAQILEAFAESGGVLTFSDATRLSGVKGSVLLYHLDRLQSLGVVSKEAKGAYRLVYKTPLAFVFEERPKTPFAYIGLLGRRNSKPHPEPEIALNLLKKEKITPSLIYVATSPEASHEWRDLRLPYSWILLYQDEIISIESIKKKVEPTLQTLLRDYIVIMDCTAATKPATIAFYELAQTYLVPLIYIYEETGRLTWLQSKESIKKKLNLQYDH